MSSVPERDDIDAEYRWDLESVFDGVEEWEREYEAVDEAIEQLAEFEADLVDDPPRFPDGETLLATLERRDEVMRRVETVHRWARMRSDEDTRDQDNQALASRGSALYSRADSAASFVGPAIQALSGDELEAMVAETEGLQRYEHHLDDVMRMKPHTRSSAVEETLSELGEVLGAPNDVYSMLTNADMTFPTVERPDGEAVEITNANFTTLLKERDRGFRREVHESFYEEMAAVRNTVGASLKNQVKRDVRLAEIRNYDTAREAALDGPNIPVEVYDTLVETVHENLDVLHGHAALKADALEVDELAMWDLYVPLVESDSPTVEYDAAAEHVVEALAPLGEDYQNRVAEGLESRWVDVYENGGKRSGAYSSGTYDTQPFILMNYQDDITSMFTLAHELGHSVHSQLTSEHQPYVYADYETFVAEVASTVNETLLTHHLLETVEDEQFRRHVLNEYLERFRSTLFRQTMFAEFEQRVHAAEEDGEALTPDRFDELYGDLKGTFYEPAAVDDAIRREWMRIPHFYYNFYVFQYATGLSAAVALVEGIREAGGDAPNGAAQNYLAFLESGSREYPLELLRAAGVDMASSEPVQRAIGVYEGYLDEMETLL
jgi:oligoendopeptidase F